MPGIATSPFGLLAMTGSKWKLELIEKVNPLWQDLYDELVAGK
jgi:hypothetical protein